MITIINQFDLHTRLYNNILYEISDEQSLLIIDGQSNNLKWISGHMLSARYALCQLARVNALDPYVELFGQGSAISDKANYPLLSDIKAKWNELSPELSTGLSGLPEKVLVKEAKFKSPIPDKSIRGMLGFFMHHEAYHLGQMSMLRRFAGKGKMSYR